MLAIFNLNLTELGVVLVGAIMVFGKDLPRVVMRGLQQLAKLRKAVTEMWREAGLEQEFKRVKAELEPELSEYSSAKKTLQDGKNLMNGPVAHWRKNIGLEVEDAIEVGGSTVEVLPKGAKAEGAKAENSDAEAPPPSDPDDFEPERNQGEDASVDVESPPKTQPE